MNNVVDAIDELISTAQSLRKGQQLPRALLLKVSNVIEEIGSQTPAQKAAVLEALRLNAAEGNTPANLLARVLFNSALADHRN